MSTDNPFFRKWLSKLSATDLTLGSVKEVAILGELSEPGIQALIGRVRQKYRPNLALAASPLPVPTGSPALLDDRPMQAGQPLPTSAQTSSATFR